MTRWQRAIGLLIIVIVSSAGPGIVPARAALCRPVVHTDVYGRGDALLAYAPMLQYANQSEEKENLSLFQDSFMDNVRQRLKEKDVYTVDWSGRFDFGCAWGAGGTPDDETFAVVKYDDIDGVFSFTDELFTFIDGLDPRRATNFSLTSEVGARSGFQLRLKAFSFTGPSDGHRLEGRLVFDTWRLSEYLKVSLAFHKAEQSTTLRMEETTIRPAHRGERLPVGAVPFRGGGQSVGARLTWGFSDRWLLTYIVDDVWAEEHAEGLVYETYTLETNKQFVGIDGYLENKPLATGVKRNYAFHDIFEPRHSVDVHVALDAPMYVAARVDLSDQRLERFLIGMNHTSPSGRVQVGWDTMRQTFVGFVDSPMRLGPLNFSTHVQFGFDHVLPRETTYLHFQGSVIASF